MFTAPDHEAFSALGTALQAYTHDRPSKAAERKGELREALSRVLDAVKKMVVRRVTPDEVVVLETSSGFMGSAFRAMGQPVGARCYRVEALPDLGARILLIAAAEREYASCRWTRSPWPTER